MLDILWYRSTSHRRSARIWCDNDDETTAGHWTDHVGPIHGLVVDGLPRPTNSRHKFYQLFTLFLYWTDSNRSIIFIDDCDIGYSNHSVFLVTHRHIISGGSSQPPPPRPLPNMWRHPGRKFKTTFESLSSLYPVNL